MTFIGSVIKFLVIALVILFALMNLQQVEVTYFFNSPVIKLPLFIVIIATLVIGMVVSSMLYFFERMKLTGEVRALKKKLKASEDENARLRSLPFTDKSAVEKREFF
jgi:putative membrane protein